MGGRQGGKSFLLCPGGTAGSEPTLSSPGLPPPRTPSLPGAAGEPRGAGGSHGPVRPDGAAPRALPGASGPGTPAPARPSRGPASPPTPRAAGLLSGDPTFLQPPPSQRGSTAPREAPHRGRTRRERRRTRRRTRGEEGGRPALTAAAASRGPQHPSSSSSTQQPAARLQPRHRGSIVAAQELRGRPCGAGIARRGSAAPSGGSPGRPSAALCPLLPAQVLPGLRYSSAPGAGGVGHAAATAPSRGARGPPTPYPRAAVLSAPGVGAASPRPAPPPDYFLQRKSPERVGGRGTCCQCRVAPQEGRARGSVSAHPAPLRCGAASAGTARTSCE